MKPVSLCKEGIKLSDDTITFQSVINLTRVGDGIYELRTLQLERSVDVPENGKVATGGHLILTRSSLIKAKSLINQMLREEKEANGKNKED